MEISASVTSITEDEFGTTFLASLTANINNEESIVRRFARVVASAAKILALLLCTVRVNTTEIPARRGDLVEEVTEYL